MQISSNLSIIGVASGWGAQVNSTEDGPIFINKNFYKIKKICNNKNYKIFWDKLILSSKSYKKYKRNLSFLEKERLIIDVCKKLQNQIINTINLKRFPIIVGGDHSLAIGTWSGIAQAYNCHEKLGLIWIDAHMDAHTVTTSLSKAIHGMPLAALMGYASSPILEILHYRKIVSPPHLILIGVRSFEAAEKSLLNKLGVKIYFMEEVRIRGFKTVLQESLSYLSNITNLIGMSLDLDVFDPMYVPGTASKEPNGLMPDSFLQAIQEISFFNKFVAFEIMEFNPNLDKNSKTIKLIFDIMRHIL